MVSRLVVRPSRTVNRWAGRPPTAWPRNPRQVGQAACAPGGEAGRVRHAAAERPVGGKAHSLQPPALDREPDHDRPPLRRQILKVAAVASVPRSRRLLAVRAEANPRHLARNQPSSSCRSTARKRISGLGDQSAVCFIADRKAACHSSFPAPPPPLCRRRRQATARPIRQRGGRLWGHWRCCKRPSLFSSRPDTLPTLAVRCANDYISLVCLEALRCRRSQSIR